MHITQIEFLRLARSFIHELIVLAERSAPPERVGFLDFCVLNEDGTYSMAVTAPDIGLGKSLGFRLLGIVPAGQTFSEPTVKMGAGNVASGTLTLNPSATAPTDGSAPVSPIPAGYTGNFTTTGTFLSDGVTAGVADIEADVMGVDDSDCTFNVLPAPGPETVGFDPTGFTAGA
jgi:hypothetical protein